VAVLVEREEGDRRAFELSWLVPVEAVVEDRSDPVRNLLQVSENEIQSISAIVGYFKNKMFCFLPSDLVSIKKSHIQFYHPEFPPLGLLVELVQEL